MTALSSWQLWAVLSAVFAALTAIFAKIGVENINSDFATFIRTVVILITLGFILAATGQFQAPGSASGLRLEAVTRKLLGNVGPDRLGGGHVGIAAVAVALAELGEAAPIERACELGIALERCVIVFDGVVALAELEIDETAGVEHVGRVGFDLERCVAICQRLLCLAGADRPHPAACAPGVEIVRLQPRHLAVIGGGAGEVALALKDCAAIVVGKDRIGIGLDGVVVVGQRPVDILLGFVGGGAAVEIVGVRRVQPQRLAVIADRTIEVALAELRGAAEVIGVGKVLQRLADHGVAALDRGVH